MYGGDGMFIEVFLLFFYVMTEKPNSASTGRNTHMCTYKHTHTSELVLVITTAQSEQRQEATSW